MKNLLPLDPFKFHGFLVVSYVIMHWQKQEERRRKKKINVFSLTCDVCSPPHVRSPPLVHAHMDMGGGGNLLPILRRWAIRALENITSFWDIHFEIYSICRWYGILYMWSCSGRPSLKMNSSLICFFQGAMLAWLAYKFLEEIKRKAPSTLHNNDKVSIP